jgi:CDP-glycerol glycerophosphotransferase
MAVCVSPKQRHRIRGDRTMSNLISVVVPIYNVEPYLRNCLDSVVAQARTCALDVILVDDGSTDGSASIAEEYCERNVYMRLVRKPNGGLGQARNVGAGCARGDYLIFLDSDDVVPDGTYQAMVDALGDERVDFVTGNVVRLRGQVTQASAAHQKSHSTDRAATHIAQHTGLLWDTTAWNKLFRRAFWERLQLSFPEGVLYEDMELMTRSHLLARQVAVLKRTSYLWRIRTEWPPSITQCRTDLQNLDDRFTAIFALFDTLGRLGTPELREAYEHKVLSLDMPIYVRHYGRNDSTRYRERLEAYVKRALRLCTTGAINRVSSVDRLKYWLISHHRAEEVAGINQCQDTHFDMCRLTVGHGRVTRNYPTLKAALPTHLTDVSKELSPHTTVYDIRRDGRTLLMDVHAFVPGLSPDTSQPMVRRFSLRQAESGRRIDLEAVPWSTRVPAAMLQLLHFDGTWSRVTLKLPADAFVAHASSATDTATWEVWVECELAGLCWSDRVRRRDGEYMDREHYVDCNGRRVRACLSGDERLVVRLEPMVAYAIHGGQDSCLESLGIVVSGNTHSGAPALVMRGDHGPIRDWPMDAAGPNDSWAVPMPAVVAAMTESGLHRSSLAIKFEKAEYRVIAPRGLERGYAGLNGQIVSVAADADGYLTLTRQPGGCHVASLALSAAGVLEMRLASHPGAPADGGLHLELVHGERGSRLPFQPPADAASAYTIDLSRAHEWSLETPIPLGEWSIAARRDGSSGEFEPHVSWHLRDDLPMRRRTNGVCLNVRVNDSGKLVLRVIADWPETSDLHAKRRKLETHAYPTLRARRVSQSVVFNSWGGAAFNDGPRRVYEELVRRVPDARMTWVARDPSAAIPNDVRKVVRGTREYFEALAEARYVVTNSYMPEHFRKHDDCRYVRLGRGIPVKRIGTDVTGVASLAVAHTQRLIRDAKQWDTLVTGHPHASCIFRGAFAYDGHVIDSGQPRLDALVEPGADARRNSVRSQLGLAPSDRLVLYAPTWRDNLFTKPGRYAMPRALDFRRLLDHLGDGWRLLVRSHPAMADRTGGRLDRRVINANAWTEMTDLYLAADVLITDYSSAIFDFVATGKPIVVFAPDLQEYQEKVRGVYWDLKADLPGPVLESTQAVIEHLQNLSGAEVQWHTRYDTFRSRFCSHEDGRATTRVVETVFAEWLD